MFVFCCNEELKNTPSHFSSSLDHSTNDYLYSRSNTLLCNLMSLNTYTRLFVFFDDNRFCHFE
jgi:hypothetical protein